MSHEVFICAVAVTATARSMAVWMRALIMLQSLRPALGADGQMARRGLGMDSIMAGAPAEIASQRC